jgi:hypothetical protein
MRSMRRADAAALFDALDRYVRVNLQQGRAQLDSDAHEDDYVSLRRFAVAVLESLDRALGGSSFEPSGGAPAGQNEHDPGIALVELLAYVADALANYADRVAAEERLRTRRRAVAAAALFGACAWCWHRRARA